MTPIREQIRAAIMSRKVSIGLLARASGIHASTISAWLAGRQNRRLGDRQLDRIAHALGARWAIILDPNMEVCRNASSIPQDQ